MVEILLLLQAATGHQHPNTEAGFNNYLGLLAEMGYSEQKQEAMLQALVESVRARVETGPEGDGHK
jgi:hypothetical protein